MATSPMPYLVTTMVLWPICANFATKGHVDLTGARPFVILIAQGPQKMKTCDHALANHKDIWAHALYTGRWVVQLLSEHNMIW